MNSKYEVKKLGDYIVQVRGISYKPTDISEEPIDTHMAVLRANSIKNNKLILEDLIYVNKDLVKENQIIKENDILIAASSGSKEIVGKSVQIKDNTNFTFGAFCKIVRCSEKIEPRYVGYFLRTPYYRSTISNLVCGANINNLKNEHIDELLIPMPSREIQQKVVNILDKSQELIDKRKKQIEALDELVKSQFIEMFGNLKDEEKLPLEKCTTFIDYRGKTPTLSESGIRIINAKSVGNGFFKYIDEYISEETYDSWMKRGFPVAGDVLFVTEGHTFGNVCRIPNDLKKFAMGQRVITMRGKGGLLNNIFLAQYMQSMAFKIDIDKYKTGSSAQGIRSKELQKILIPIPNIELQNKFADFVKQVDKLKFEMEKSLKELEDNFNSLMQKAFKGELFN